MSEIWRAVDAAIEKNRDILAKRKLSNDAATVYEIVTSSPTIARADPIRHLRPIESAT